MARFVASRRANPASNPSVFGEDVTDLAITAAGLGATAFANDQLVAPVVRNVTPSGSELTTKAVDAGTTGVTAWLLGELVGMLDNATGRKVRRGGLILATGKLISAVVPGFSISAKIPNPPFLTPGVVSAPKNGNGKPAMNGAAAGTPALPPAETTLTRLGVGSMGI